MDKKTISIIIIALVVFVGIYYFQIRERGDSETIQQEKGVPTTTTEEAAEEPAAPKPASPKPASPKPTVPAATNIVKIKKSSFEPSVATVKRGTSITWINEDSLAHQVASDPHPIHSDLPGLESKVLPMGGTYTFEFITPGVFGYHDHLNPSIRGTIIITD